MLTGISGAVSDSEIKQFAAGVLAGAYLNDPSILITADSLILQDKLSEYSDGDVSSIGYDLYDLSSAADKIVKQYPDRFTLAEAKIMDPSGVRTLGRMTIAVE